MEKSSFYTHPMNLYPQRIREEGIVVFDNIRGLPSGDEPFTSSDYVIAIGHRGRIELMYDDISDFSGLHTVGVIFPNHCLRKVSVTDDYLATLIIVDAAVLNDPILQIIKQLRYRYEPHPNVKLDKHEYRIITHVVEGMREITRLDLPDRRMLMTRLLEFLLRRSISVSTATWASMPRKPACRPNISAPSSSKRQSIPPPTGFTTKWWLKPRCYSTYGTTSPCRQSPTYWASMTKQPSADISAARLVYPRRSSVHQSFHKMRSQDFFSAAYPPKKRTARKNSGQSQP